MNADGRATQRTNLFGQATAAGAAALFGTAYVGTAFALRSFTPMGAAMWRGLLSTAILVAVIALSGSRLRRSEWAWPRLSRVILLGLSGGLGFVVSMNVAVSMAGATLAAFAASLSPVLAAMLSPFVLGERLTIPSIGGFAVAIVGTALLSGANSGEVGPGVLFGLGASLCFGLFLLLSRRWAHQYHLSGTAIALSIAGTTWLGLLPFELALEPARVIPEQVGTDALLGLLWLALVPGVLAQLFVVASVRRIETRSSAAMLLISPVTATVLAALLLGEAVSGPEIVGAGLVLLGIVGAAALDRAPPLRGNGAGLG
ncbi:MAG: DMT family transporter [Candidatus Limnocylindrales bacterium]